MTVALLVNRCDRIASGAEVAGLPFTETAAALGQAQPRLKAVERVSALMDEAMGTRKRGVPLLVVHAQGDPVISAEAAINVRDSWGHCFAIDTEKPIWRKSGSDHGTRWQHLRYASADRHALVETLMLEHTQHGWYGGHDGRYGFTDAPDISRGIWAFFDANRLDAAGSRSGLFGPLRFRRVA